MCRSVGGSELHRLSPMFLTDLQSPLRGYADSAIAGYLGVRCQSGRMGCVA